MSDFRISADHDTTPTSLEALSPPLFDEYGVDEIVFTEWSPYQELLQDGNRGDVPVGLPSVKATFFRLSRAEYAYLRALAGEVSIRALAKDTNAYGVYNATLREHNSADLRWDRDTGLGADEIVFEFIDLVAQA